MKARVAAISGDFPASFQHHLAPRRLLPLLPSAKPPPPPEVLAVLAEMDLRGQIDRQPGGIRGATGGPTALLAPVSFQF